MFHNLRQIALNRNNSEDNRQSGRVLIKETPLNEAQTECSETVANIKNLLQISIPTMQAMPTVSQIKARRDAKKKQAKESLKLKL